MGYFQKKSKQEMGEVEEILFFKKRLEFLGFSCHFTLGILDKTKLHPWKFHKIVLHP